MKRIEAVNDFVVKFANVNGSGSASAKDEEGVIGYQAHTVAPPYTQPSAAAALPSMKMRSPTA